MRLGRSMSNDGAAPVRAGATAVLCRALLVAALCVVAVPAVASANTLWVSTHTPSPPFASCEHPGYNSIQAAVNAPGTAIHVCPGTYKEQVAIEREVVITGYEGATLEVPSTPHNAVTTCDKAIETGSGFPTQSLLSVCGSHKVSVRSLNLNAVWPGEPDGALSCAYRVYGVVAAGNANLTLTGSNIVGARGHTEINGCQWGVGLLLGSYYAGPATVKLSTDAISEYDKNGMAIEHAGTTATISRVTVKGAGPTAAIAQNGIGVQEGAKAAISASTISGNECNNPVCGPDALTQTQSTGIYFYEAGFASSIKTSTITENDIGADAGDEPLNSPTISSNHFESNRFESAVIEYGGATLTSNTMTKSNVGIEVLQFEGQPFAPGGKGVKDTMTEMSKWAVLGRSDKGAGDKPGTFSITSSKISGNPGPLPAESVEDENSPSLKIIAEKDS